jgi:multidrug efflux pump subunit AcrB
MSIKPYQPTNVAGKLAKGFLNNPLTLVLGIFLLVIGYISLEVMPREENPQMTVSGSNIIVALPGASAKEVERVIVKPLERKLKEVKGIEHIYGRAMNNVGIVTASFYIGQNREISDLKIYDKIMQNMNVLPKNAMNPVIKPLDIDIVIPIVTVAFYSTKPHQSKSYLFDRVTDIQNKINALQNVAVTQIKGGYKHQFNIQVDINKLAGYNLSLGQIAKAVQSLAYDVPDIKNQTKNNKIVIFGIKNAIDSVKDIQNIIVADYNGSPIYLKQVAKVTEGYDYQSFHSALISMRQKNGSFSPLQNQVTLTVSKLKGTNAVVIAKEIEKQLKSYEPLFQKEGIGYTVTRDYGKRANDAVNELVKHLIISIVIIAILLIFVLGWRESLIVTFTVPAILAVTLFVAYLGGQTINRITLFAFLLSLGLLVDAAIIVIENIHRHFHAIDLHHHSTDDLLIEATDEIGSPTNIATFAIILTMVPMGFVGHMMGQFMKPIPLNVPVALIASLFVAYIFTPYLASRILKKPKHKQEHTNV